MKYLKRIFIAIFSILLLVGIAVFVLLTFYKKEMATMLTDSLKTNYGLTLKVSDVKTSFLSNWPQASVQLQDVYISNDSMGKNVPLLKAGSLSLSFDLKKLLNKQFIIQSVSIKNAEVNLEKHADGSRNFEFKKPPAKKDTSASAISFEVSKISIQDTKFNFTNHDKPQHIGIQFVDNTIRLTHFSDGIDIKLKGKLLVEELLFNAKKGAFLRHARATVDLDMDYFKESKIICIHAPSDIEIDKQIYNVSALINTDAGNKRLALHISNTDIWYEKVSRLLTPKLQKVLSNFEIKKPLAASVLIVTNLGKKEEPVLIVNVEGRNSDLTIGNSKIPYSNVLFSGKVISIDKSMQRGSNETAKVIFRPVSGKLYDFPFTASVVVTNLADPHIKIDAGLYIEASKIKTQLDKEFILKGSCSAKLEYSGPADKLNKQDFLSKEMRLNANIFFNDLCYQEHDRPYKYIVKGKANLNNHDLKFDNLLLRTQGGDALLKGKADGFVDYILGFSNGFNATLAAKSESLNLNPFLVKNMYTPADTAVKQTAKDYKKTLQKDQSHFQFNISLSAKKLLARKVEASNANIDVFYKTNFLNIKSASMNTCEGKIMAKGTMENFNKVNAEMLVQDLNVNTMFKQFENFGQKAIEADNLKGNIFVDAKFKMGLDDNMEIIGETMVGDVKLKLKDGHLINYEPVQSMSNFIFRNRDFNDVIFTELNETFRIKGFEMQIEELEIASSVLNLYVVNGLYNFKGNSNMNILIPWSNLRRRGKNYIPKSSGESAENTKGLKLNFSGPSSKMKLSLGHKDVANK